MKKIKIIFWTIVVAIFIVIVSTVLQSVDQITRYEKEINDSLRNIQKNQQEIIEIFDMTDFITGGTRK